MQHGGNIASEVTFADVTTQTDLHSIFDNCTSNSLAQIMLLEGAPGIGKTIVAKEIAYRWAKNKMLSNIKLLLLIFLKEFETHRITCFEELMYHCYPDDKNIASSCAKHFIKTQGKNLMIIFDGYDEMTNADQRMSNNYFMKLLQRKTLPDSCLVVTSRPYITVHLHQYCNCRIEIVGFTKDDRHTYFRENLSSKELAIVTNYLEKHFVIDSLCYIPLNLVSFLTLVEHDIDDTEKLPKTQTELTGYTVHLTVARNKDKEEKFMNASHTSVFKDIEIEKIITDIASIAYAMLEKKQLLFSETDIKSFGFSIKNKHENYGLLKAVQINDVKNKQHKKVYSFVHFSVQEYLAAYHLSKQFSLVRTLALQREFWNVKYFGVWRMYAGLTKGNDFPLQVFLSKEWYIIGNIRYSFGFKFPGIAHELRINKVICLQLFQIFLEAPDSEIKESICDVVKNDTINLSEADLSCTDTNMLSYFVARSYITKEWQIINLCNCNIDDDKLKLFYQGLCIEDGRENPLIRFLDISQNKICELNTLINLITKCKVIHLNASKNLCAFKCTATNIDDFCNKALKKLNLSSNHLRSEDIHILCNGLKNCKSLEEVDLSNNDLDDESTGYLIEAIVQWDNLREFKYESNNFSDHASSLLEFTINHLKFNSKRLDFKGEVMNISHFIAVLGYAKSVSIRHSNYINCISQLRELLMYCVKSKGLTLTADASIFFQNNFKLLENLNLSGLTIDEKSANAIAFGDNLQCLKLNRCKLTSQVTVIIAHKIQRVRVKVFELMENCIDDKVIEELAITILHWGLLKSIKLEKNNISAQCMLLLKMLTEDVEQLSIVDFENNAYAIKAFIEVLDYTSCHVGQRVTQFLANLSKITELSLEVQTPLEMTLNASNTLNEGIRNMTSLNVSGIIITEEVADNLGTFFDNNQKSLIRLIMNDCKLNSSKLLKFVHELHLTVGIKEAQFCNNEINDNITRSLVISILHWNTIQTLKLENNCFEDDGRSMKVFEMVKEFSKFHDKSINFNGKVDKIITFITLLGYMATSDFEYVYNSVTFNKVSQVEKLSLDCSENNSTNVQFEVYASKFFTRFVNLTELNISGIKITTEVADDLSRTFHSKLCPLEHLIMNNCKLTSAIIHIIIVPLQNCLKLTELKLSNNNIDDTATEVIATAIFHWEHLELFVFKGKIKQLSQENELLFEFLLSHLKFSSSSLNLSGNQHNLASFITLLGYMKKVPTNESKYVENISKVTTLNLNFIDQHSTGAQLQLTEMSSEGFQIFNHLVSLNISGIIINENTAKHLVKTFEFNQQLEELFMNKCQITTPIMKAFCQQLQHISVKVLEIIENCIDDKVIEELAITILHWYLLKSIKVEKNHISAQCMLLLKMLTEDVKKLSIVDFANKYYAIKAFLKVLDYTSCHIGQRVTQFLSNLSKITELSLEVQTPLEMTLNASNTLNKGIRNMTSLNVSGIIITEQVADNLCGLLNNNQKSLNHLIMNNCKFTSPVVLNLIINLPKCVSMKELQLCNNFLNDEVAEALIVSILHLKDLQLLKLEQNSFSNNYEKLFHLLTNYLTFSDTVINFNNDMDSIMAFITLLEYMQGISLNVLNFVDNISKVESLSLDCSKENTVNEEVELTAKASQFFRRFQLTKLNLSGIIINEVVIDNVLEAFDDNLQSLFMNNCKLNSQTVIELIQKLQNVKNIGEFELCNNDINDEATESLVKAILHWNSVKHIKLENNRFSEKGTKLFLFLNKFSNFSGGSINFNGNLDATIPFITLLGYMVEVNVQDSVLVENVSKVTKLLLDCSEQNNINVEFEVDASKFFTRFDNLTELNISGIVISKVVADNLANTFDGNLQSLKCLIMNNCKLTSSIVINLIRKLPNCVSMKELQLCNNRLNDKVTETLIFSILHLNKLQLLKVEQNCFSKRYEKAFNFLTKYLNFSDSVINFNDDMDSIIAFTTLLECMESISFNVSNFVDNLSKVESLSLDCSKQNTAVEKLELTVKASRFFQRFQLIKLNLSGIIVKETVIDNIGQAFGAHLQSLCMNNCDLNSKTVIKLMQKLQKAKNINTFEVCNNDITDEATESLVKAILHWNSAEHIKLENSGFTEKDIKLMKFLIEFSSFSRKNFNELQLLKLEQNSFSKKFEKVFYLLRRDLSFSDSVVNFDNDMDSIMTFITLLEYMQGISVNVLNFVDNVSKVKTLSLDCSKQNTAHEELELTAKASQFFQRFQLIKLNLSGIIIKEEVIDNILKAFGSDLQSLILNKCKLNSETVMKLMRKLNNTRNIKEVELCNNDIDDRAMGAIGIGILHWDLAEVKLEDTKLSEQCNLLLKFFERDFQSESIIFTNNYHAINSCIQILSFVDSNSDKKTLQKTLQFTRNFLKTSTLNFSCCQQEPVLFLSFHASCFFQQFKNLRELNLSGIMIKQQAANMLSNAFRSNSYSLEHLIMNRCCLTSKMFGNFVTQLKNSASIEDLQWCDNKIGDEAIEPIATAILSWNSLKNIEYSNNNFSTNCILLLKLLKEHNVSTSVIDFSNDNNSIKSLISVLSCISKYDNANTFCFKYNISQTTKLSLECSQLKEKVEISCEVVATLKDFTCLTELNISSITISEDKVDVFFLVFKDNLQRLQHLHMNNCQLSSIAVIRFTKALQNKNIKEIQLCNNLIDDEATEALVTTILNWESPLVKLQDNAFSRISQLQLNLITSEMTDCDCIINDDASVKLFLTILHCKNIYFDMNMSKVSKLSLCCSSKERIQLSHYGLQSFKYFINISKLEISGMFIDKQAARTISQVLGNNQCTLLKELKLNYCQLTSHLVLMILSVRNKTTTKLALTNLVHLDLSNNKIDDNATSSVIKALLQMPHVQITNFDKNKFKNQNMKILNDFILKMKELKSSNIKLLDSEQIAIFLSVLSRMKNISEEVSLQVKNICRIDKLHIECLDIGTSIALTKNMCLSYKQLTHLRKLKLFRIQFTSKKAIRFFADCIAHSLPSLEALVLVKCNLDSESAVRLLSTDNIVPMCFRTLKIIDFSHNFIEDDAIQPLVNSFLQMPNFQKLCLHGNKFTNVVQILNTLFDWRIYSKKPDIDYNNIPGSRVCISSFFDLLGLINECTVERSSYVQDITKIKRLNLEYHHDDPLVLKEKEAKFFQRFSCLEELNLSGIHIHSEAIKTVAYALQSCCCLLTLKLKKCQLNSDSVKSLFFLANSDTNLLPNLRDLDLSDNNIDDSASPVLIKSFIQISHSVDLNIAGNRFSGSNAKALSSASSNFTSYKSSITYNEVLDPVECVKGFLILISAITDVSVDTCKFNHIIKVESLSLNCGVSVILSKETSLFFSKFSNLKQLKLNRILINAVAADLLAKAINVNLTLLEVLKLSGCFNDSNSVITVVSALNKEKIRKLSLPHNNISHETTNVLKSFMDNNETLNKLNLSHNCIGTERIKVISDGFANCKNLTHINMSYNNLATEGTIKLTEGLANCRNLEKLDLTNNNITNDATEQLVKLMKQLYQYGNFKSLLIDNNKLSQQSIQDIHSSWSWKWWVKFRLNLV